SLALAQLAWHIQHEFGIALSFSQLFAQPTAASLARLVQELPPEKTAAGTGSLPTVARKGDLPLSFAQQRVWFLEQLHPRNEAYHFQSVLRWYGRLNVPALEAALNDLVGRHEIWRTTFPAVAGSPVQRIHAFEPFTLVVEEVSREEARRRIEAAVREPFELG